MNGDPYFPGPRRLVLSLRGLARSSRFWALLMGAGLLADLVLFTFCGAPGPPCPDAVRNPPPEVLGIPALPGVDAQNTFYYANGINAQGMIIGSAETASGSVNISRAFLVSRDGGDFRWLDAPEGHFIPSAINDSGLIVGTCLASLNVTNSGRPPPPRFGAGRACAVHGKTPGDFIDLHPPGLAASQATHVSASGVIGGLCFASVAGDRMTGYPEAEYRACLFDGRGGIARTFRPELEGTLLTALSDDWAAVRILPKQDRAADALVFSLADTALTLEPELPGETAAIEDINGTGLAVGTHFNLNSLVAEIFTLALPDEKAAIVGDLQLPPGAVLRAVQNVRLNDKGMASFTASLDGPDQPGKLKPYAIRIGAAGLHDMTPPGLDGYGEARDIGPDGTVVGYTGVQGGNCLILNRAFASPFPP